MLSRTSGAKEQTTENTSKDYYLQHLCTAQQLHHRYVPTQPAIFSVGDIVEIQASFVIFPLKEKKFKTAMILRSIALLDRQFTQV